MLCTCVFKCLVPTCFCIQMWLCAAPPTLGSNTVIENTCKGEGTVDNEAKCADKSIQRQKGARSVGWGKGASSRYTVPYTVWLKCLLTNTLLFYFPSALSLSLYFSLCFFLCPLFPEGCLQLKQRELILSSFLPPFFYLIPLSAIAYLPQPKSIQHLHVHWIK